MDHCCRNCCMLQAEVGLAAAPASHPPASAGPTASPCGTPAPLPQADEELLLLEGIEIYGLGNWPKVAGGWVGGWVI